MALAVAVIRYPEGEERQGAPRERGDGKLGGGHLSPPSSDEGRDRCHEHDRNRWARLGKECQRLHPPAWRQRIEGDGAAVLKRVRPGPRIDQLAADDVAERRVERVAEKH